MGTVHINKNMSVNAPELAKRLFFIYSPEKQMLQNKPKNRNKIKYTKLYNIDPLQYMHKQ